MNKSTFVAFTTLFAITLFSCSQSEKEATETAIDPLRELEFDIVDSMIVDVLPELIALDYHAGKDHYLMKERRGNGIYLIDGSGAILSQPELVGEGPNQVYMIWEGKFFGEEQYIFKEMSESMDFHVFDSNFDKVQKIRGAATGLNSIFLSFYRQTFTVWEENGKTYLIGEEVNSYNPADADPDKIGADFYNRANTGYFYNLNADSISYLNLYSDAWEPKKTKRWIGQSFPYLAFDTQRQRAAVLPPLSDQLFLYELQDGKLINEQVVNLNHPDRNQSIPDPSREYLLYPSFNDVKNFGEYQLAIFYTPVPEEVYAEFRAKDENYSQDPEWRKAIAQYRNPRYIIVKDGIQLGILNDLPVAGNVNLGLADGTLLIKAAAGEVERDYNLFYKIRMRATQ
jgi:hypothetical protein